MVVTSFSTSGHALAQHRAHALGDGETAELFGGGPTDDQTAHLGRDAQQLVDADAVVVAGAGAEVAARAVEELRLVGCRHCAGGRRRARRRRACTAPCTSSQMRRTSRWPTTPTTDEAIEERLDAHVEEAVQRGDARRCACSDDSTK